LVECHRHQDPFHGRCPSSIMTEAGGTTRGGQCGSLGDTVLITVVGMLEATVDGDGPCWYFIMHKKFCKHMDTIIAFIWEYSKVSYLSTGKQWLKKLIVHRHVSTNLVYRLD
jgi:hypothetical protein